MTSMNSLSKMRTSLLCHELAPQMFETFRHRLDASDDACSNGDNGEGAHDRHHFVHSFGRNVRIRFENHIAQTVGCALVQLQKRGPSVNIRSTAKRFPAPGESIARLCLHHSSNCEGARV